MRYVLVSQRAAGANGVGSYSRAVAQELAGAGIHPVLVTRDPSVPHAQYRTVVRDTITARFRSSEVLVEAPEVNAPSLLLSPDYHVHARLHCPSAFVSAENAQPVDREEFERELEVVRRAAVVSSPSYALVERLRPYVDVSGIHVYKNPPPVGLVPADPATKTHEVAFLGRFRRAKGVDFLNPVLSALPPSYSVVLAGRGFDEFRLASTVRCRVRVHGEVQGVERDQVLAGARAVLMLSRFENCSMLVLECLALGTVVVGWQVGGHAEIAGPDLIRLVPFGDLDALVAMVVQTVEGVAPSPSRFQAATAAITEDFRHGWSHIWDATTRGERAPLYRGFDASGRG